MTFVLKSPSQYIKHTMPNKDTMKKNAIVKQSKTMHFVIERTGVTV